MVLATLRLMGLSTTTRTGRAFEGTGLRSRGGCSGLAVRSRCRAEGVTGQGAGGESANGFGNETEGSEQEGGLSATRVGPSGESGEVRGGSRVNGEPPAGVEGRARWAATVSRNGRGSQPRYWKQRERTLALADFGETKTSWPSAGGVSSASQSELFGARRKGRSIKNWEPIPGVLSRRMVPFMLSTTRERTMAKPTPP